MYSHDEPSIYNLLAVEETKEIKAKRYTSKFRQNVKEEYASYQGANKTMGPTKVIQPQPENYLTKHAKEPRLHKKRSFHYPDENCMKPPVVKKGGMPLMGLKTNKNLVCVNANKNITSLPTIPTKRFVDTRLGDTHNLIPSGLEPVYVHKKDFGEVPVYLTRRKEEVERAKNEYDQYIAQQFTQGALRPLTAEEHKAILDGLKTNWDDMQDRYQSLPVVTDTLGKKNRRERMEVQMKQLERDIELFEKYKIVYIEN